MAIPLIWASQMTTAIGPDGNGRQHMVEGTAHSQEPGEE